ncbi:MAG: histidine kinase [Saprospiraceae bacterium]|nr:histidine kinase [Saprospiraceae bacterium]
MDIAGIKKYFQSDRFIPVIFHLVFWTIWIAFPFVTNSGNEKFRQYSIAMLPVTLTHIPLFLLNSEWLIPKIFRKKGIRIYLLYLLALVLVFATFQLVLKESIIPEDLIRHHWDIFWAVVPALFITAISTGYGFIYYQIKQDQVAQEMKQEQLKSELSFLRSQISPHFIFNILNSIVYLIRSKSPQAESVTIRLSELMRYMLYESSDTQVPLEKELEYLSNYIELQRIRFDEDVDISVDVKGNVTQQMIEPMLLIPFVENAFKHGVGLIENPSIQIKILVDENKLDFQVQNKINDADESKDRDSGIGLKNVNRRLELLYPGSHQLNIIRRDNWFIISLILDLNQRSYQ